MAKCPQRMCPGCCSSFTPAPTSRKDCELLTIKTELDLCTERRAGGSSSACRASGRPVVRDRPLETGRVRPLSLLDPKRRRKPCKALRTQGPHWGPRGQGRGAGGSPGSPCLGLGANPETRIPTRAAYVGRGPGKHWERTGEGPWPLGSTLLESFGSRRAGAAPRSVDPAPLCSPPCEARCPTGAKSLEAASWGCRMSHRDAGCGMPAAAPLAWKQVKSDLRHKENPEGEALGFRQEAWGREGGEGPREADQTPWLC